jgi:hypothetical protein
VLVSGLYLLLAAIVSYGFGAYLAGRMRPRLTTGTPEEIEFRDGTHGLLVWALATLLTGLLALAAVQSLSRAGSPPSVSAAPSASVAGESLIAFDSKKSPIPPGRVQRRQMADHVSCFAVRADSTISQSPRAAGKIVQCLAISPSPEGFVPS